MTARTLFHVKDAKAAAVKSIFDGMSFGGGGSMGTAHVAVYGAVEDAKQTDGMTFMAGTSIGALMALGAALNFPASFLAVALHLDLIKLAKFGDTYAPSYSTFKAIPTSHLAARIGILYKPAMFAMSYVKGCYNALANRGKCKGEYIEEVATNLAATFIAQHREQLKLKIQAQKLLDREDANKKALHEKLNNILDGKADLTFAALHQFRLLAPELHLKDLYVTATCISSKPKSTAEMFSHETTPDMPIAKAIHCSMAFPGMYSPVVYDNKMYVDGGLTCNIPYHYFKQKQKNVLCAGFGIGSNKSNFHDLKKLGIPLHLAQLMTATLAAQEVALSDEDLKSFVNLDIRKIAPFDFTLTHKDQYEKLMKPGYETTVKALKERWGITVTENFLNELDKLHASQPKPK